MKVVINVCYGGFSLSPLAELEITTLRGNHQVTEFHTDDDFGGESMRDIARNDPHLVAVVELLREKANGDYAKLKVVEIPDDVKWVIDEHDGFEWVAEQHRTWQ